MTSEHVLSSAERAFLMASRRAVLVTIARDGRPRPLPICFVLADEADVLYTPIDDKPKRVADPRTLARVGDIVADPRVAVLVDRWDEDWTRLAWLRVAGRAGLVEPNDLATDAEHRFAVEALRRKYPQYATHALDDRPIIRVALERATGWGAIDPAVE
jgi:PPOX class probable F420-dependent enzyme